MNILRLELRMNRNSLLSWSISLPLLMLFFMSIYPAFAKELDLFLKLMESFPKALLQAMGMEHLGFGGTLGYYSFMMLYILLAGSIQAMNLGVSVLSAEVRDKTADFLYAKPISRSSVVFWKISAVFLQIILTNLVFISLSWLVILAVVRSLGLDPVGTGLFFRLSGTLALIQVFFVSFGLFVSSFMKRIRTTLPISMGVVFFFFIINVLNDTLKNETLGYLTPFNYFNPEVILISGSYEIRYLLLLAALVILFITATALAYQKKDFPSI